MDGRLSGSDTGRAGVLYGFSAYFIWGTLPLFFVLLPPAGAWEILAHRICWSLLFCAVVLTVFRRPWPTWRRPARELVGIVLASLLIGINWVSYLYAVTTDRVTEAALGYFLNPLVSIALGLLLLGERLRPLQSAAVAVGALGGGYLVLSSGSTPWIAFVLATSFGFYAFVKKRFAVGLGAVTALTAETMVLTPLALAGIVWFQATGHGTFTAHGPAHALLLAATGIATALPLLLFGMAASRLPLVMLGLLQFIAPIMQFCIGLLLGETMTPERWIGFGIVWVAVSLLALDSVRRR
ncbi:MAG: EamA family transporter RarD [Mobilicoccus sp.]|nr:EamA family transporter RarD [Mobilicoccus sp.]